MRSKGCLVTVSVILFALLASGGWVYYRMNQPSEIIANLPTVVPSNEAAVTFSSKYDDFVATLKAEPVSEGSSPPPPSTLEISETEMTSKVAAVVETANLPVEVENPQVHFRDDRIKASADVNVSGVVVPVAVQAQVETEAGKPKLVIEKIDIAGLGVPESVKQQIRDAINAGVDPKTLQGLPFDIESLKIENGVMTIIARPPSR